MEKLGTMAYKCQICNCNFSKLQALKAHEQSIRHALRVEQIARREDLPIPAQVLSTGTSIVSAHEATEISQFGESAHEGQQADFDLAEFGISERDGAPFDSTLQVASFIRQCRSGMGLSNQDIRALFAVLFHQKFDLSNVNIRTVRDLQKYEKSLMSIDRRGWQRHILREASATSAEVLLHFQDPLHVLANLFSSKKNREGFELYPKPQSEADHQYTTAASGRWWREMQAHVDRICPGGVIAPIILYSDQTSLSNNRQTQGYPLMMSIANIQCSLRGLVDGNALLAILPIMSKDGTEGSGRQSLPKIEILHEALKVVLASLKAASYRGIPLEDPFGNRQWVFPLLFAYICDHPEGCKVSCTYDTNRCSLPCSCCLCPNDQLANVNQKFPSRKEDEMKRIYNEIDSCSTAEEAKEKSRQWSLHTIYNSLWGFNGGDTEMGNPYHLIHPDTLHMLDVGVFSTIIDIIREMAVSNQQYGPRALKMLDKRLKTIRNDHRYSEFRLPVCSGSHQYFLNGGNFAAWEHRAVMQVVIFLLVGQFPNGVLTALRKYLEWYGVAIRSSQHNEESLSIMTNLLTQCIIALKQHLGAWQRSNFGLVKVHAMSHLAESIKRSGLPWEYSTNLYEQLHISLMKIAYRGSNRRAFNAQIVAYHERLKAIREKMYKQDPNIGQPIDRETTLDSAVATGQNVFAGFRFTMRPIHLQDDEDGVRPRAVSQLLEEQPEIRTHFLSALNTYLEDGGLCVSKNLEVMSSLAIATGDGERFGDWPLYVRATMNFHGRPYFSDISVQVENIGETPETWYGQLRLLFKCDTISLSGAKSMQELVFVGMYHGLPSNNLTRLVGCDLYTWKTNLRAPSGRHIRQRRARDFDEYLVLPTSNILRAVHMVRNFAEDNQYFMNKYKF